MGSRLAGAVLIGTVWMAAVAAGAQMTLSWSDNSDNEDGFLIERSSNGSSFTQVAAVGPNTTSYVDATLSAGTTYWFRVRAYNSAGNSAYSNTASGTTAPVAPTNTAPTISNLQNQTIAAGSSTGALAFTIGDAQTPAASLTISATSSNTTLLSNSNIVLGGSGANRTLTATPAANQSGTTTVTVTVSDGALTASDTFVLTVNAPPPPPAPGASFFFGTFNSDSASSFGLYVRSDRSAVMLAALPGTQRWIDAAGFTVSSSGTFSFSAAGLGTLNGTISGTQVSGSIAGTGITFSGTQDATSGATAALAGLYDAVILNTSDGTILVVAGSAGRAFVFIGQGGAFTGTTATLSTSGNINATLPDGRTVALSLGSGAATVSGSIGTGGQMREISGQREDVELEERPLTKTSALAQVRQGSGITIAGFVVSGPGNKQILIRGVGPTLVNFDVPNVLSDPMILLYRRSDPPGSQPIAQNDDWGLASNAAQISSVSAALDAFPLPTGSKDAALLVSLPAGDYTAHVTGAGGATGTAIVEVYDADIGLGVTPTADLTNISMRGEAGNDGNAVTTGFVVTGSAPKRLLIRAVGSELAQFNVTGTLSDPVLRVYRNVDGSDNLIATNDDWEAEASVISSVTNRIDAFDLDPGSKSAAMVIWLAPGVYTAQGTSATDETGVALVEVYEAP